MSDVLLTLDAVSVPGRLRPVSLEVPRGALHAVVGTNGSGKSTLLDCVLGLQPHQGRVSVQPGARVAVVPQRLEHLSTSALTVLEFFAASWTTRPCFLGIAKDVRARAQRALSVMTLEPALHRPLGSLSGGEHRRVLIAHALAQEPSLLLLDEPEAGLDAASKAALLEQLERVTTAGAGVVWVSHDGDAVRTLATSRSHLEAA